MALNFLYSRNNNLLLFIIIFLARLKLLNFSNCAGSQLDSKDCFNNIIKFDNKKYRASQISTDNKNNLIIEFSDESPGDSRLLYYLKEETEEVFSQMIQKQKKLFYLMIKYIKDMNQLMPLFH